MTEREVVDGRAKPERQRVALEQLASSSHRRVQAEKPPRAALVHELEQAVRRVVEEYGRISAFASYDAVSTSKPSARACSSVSPTPASSGSVKIALGSAE